jgi:hypothetical protein
MKRIDMLLSENGHAVRAACNQVCRSEAVVEDGTHADVRQPVDLSRNVVRRCIAFFDTDEVVVADERRRESGTKPRLLVGAGAERVDPSFHHLAEVIGLGRLVLVWLDQVQRLERLLRRDLVQRAELVAGAINRREPPGRTVLDRNWINRSVINRLRRHGGNQHRAHKQRTRTEIEDDLLHRWSSLAGDTTPTGRT